MANVLDAIYNTDEKLGVQVFGPAGWNRLKGRVCGTTAAMVEHPERSAKRPISIDRSKDELFIKLFRPDVRAGAELLGGGWCERVTDSTMGDIFEDAQKFLSSQKVETASNIFHNAANIVSYIPGYGKYVEGGRKTANFAADVLNRFGFGTTGEQVTKAAKWGGVFLLGGAGVAIWYFGFHKKKKGRK